MIRSNSLDQSYQKHKSIGGIGRQGPNSQSFGGTGGGGSCGSCDDGDDMDVDSGSMDTTTNTSDVNGKEDDKLSPKGQDSEDGHSHSRTVQALRKYLQRKLSSEDSSSERESPQEKVFQRPLDTAGDATSTLTCSIVYPSSGKSNFPLQKQRSLDDYSIHPTPLPDTRYLRTDLCVPILLSRCNFCDRSFELEDELRAHMRESHWHYFLDKSNYIHSHARHHNTYDDMKSSSDDVEVLDLSMRKLTEAASLPNLQSLSVDQPPTTSSSAASAAANSMMMKISKKPVKCITCGKGFSTKWNWKQHQKIHLRENLQAYLQ